MAQESKCKVCGASPTMLDKFYRQTVCSTHLAQRKADAIANMHTEWLTSNGFVAEATELELGNFDASQVRVESSGDEDIPGR